MRLMISGATTTVESFAQDPAVARFLGTMVTPATGNSLERLAATGLPLCLDNAAFNASRFDGDAYLSLLKRVSRRSTRPVFVTVPDQVGNHEATAYLFDRWLRRLAAERLLDLPLAFVLQDGIESPDDVPWDFIEAVFIGGSTDFKDDTVVTCDIIPEAKARGKWVHMGRVNSKDRLRLAINADCDSVDGTSLSMFSKTYIPTFVRWIEELEAKYVLMHFTNQRLERELTLNNLDEQDKEP